MSIQGKGLGSISSEMRTGSARKETDSLSTGSLLLSFMTQASGNVKTALEKPANFKRNINHRRYLQKQLRNYSKKKGDLPAKKTTSLKYKNSQAGKQNYKSQNGSYVKSLRDATWLGSDKERNALKERNLPESFWQEPLIPTFQQDYSGNMYQYQTRSTDDYTHTSPNQDIESYLNGWNSAVAAYDSTPPRTVSEFTPTDPIPAITPEEGLIEDFMTGEELTRNIDIKDLYVPEMYSADKLLNDVQETMFAGQISPSQYYLPSPSPYSTEQHYQFNFSFEHDAQGLPPIAMAFFGQNTLAQC